MIINSGGILERCVGQTCRRNCLIQTWNGRLEETLILSFRRISGLKRKCSRKRFPEICGNLLSKKTTTEGLGK